MPDDSDIRGKDEGEEEEDKDENGILQLCTVGMTTAAASSSSSSNGTGVPGSMAMARGQRWEKKKVCFKQKKKKCMETLFRPYFTFSARRFFFLVCAEIFVLLSNRKKKKKERE